MANINQDELILEEQEKLDSVIREMDDMMLQLHHDWNQKDLDSKKQKDACLADTYGALIDDNNAKENIQNEIKELQVARDQLYSFRIDLHLAELFDDYEESDLELKIGEHSYIKDGNILIYSWKAPICLEFLLNNSLKERINEKTVYNLKGKREVRLDFDRVTKVIQLYSKDSNKTETILSDAFLQELLARRSETEFKNIIFSIQKKQGEIIQKPFRQNIIVQGCAGSGKSMIMLHRLSILLYDNQNGLNLENIYIISPSATYIQQAQAMLYQLEITGIQMGTLEQYYQFALSKYKRKIEDCGSIISTRTLTVEQENYIYSRKCIDDIVSAMRKVLDEDHTDYRMLVNLLSLQDDLIKQFGNKSNRTFYERIRARLYICRRFLSANSMDEAIKKILLDQDYVESIIETENHLEQHRKNLELKIYRSIMKKMGQETDRNGRFKRLPCSAYLYLQILYQFRGVPKSVAERLITIDETQNLAIEEIYLIKNLNGEDVILNLFGDINQHFESTKGIDDWLELSHIAQFEISDINENYRNATQITEYCNEQFHTNMKTINYEGAGYKEYHLLENYNDEINQILLYPLQEGISAILVLDRREANYIKNVFSNFTEKINNMIDKNAPINEAKWNLMTIDQARGLEFRTVLVLSGRMTQNQKYVAYTRALDQLYIFDKAVELSEEDIAINSKKKRSLKNQEKNEQSLKKQKATASPGSAAKQELNFGHKVKDFFEKAGLKVIDKRPEGNYLGIVGDKEKLEKYVEEAVDRFQISGKYVSSKALRSQIMWYTNTKL